IRELRNVIRQAVLLASGPAIRPEEIKLLFKGTSASLESPGPLEVPVLPGLSLKQIGERAMQAAEKQAIRNALAASKGNKSQAAKILKTTYKTLHLNVKKYKL